ncbi:hypothetical protein CGRA01v4_04656 [Colletotrichum graminicola]|uniref:Uncharacterized protein n=1 Tax=Colletotrichum graminicola (strain M1.001 / M2 / FGSC 10212) TaxID=645133 RepID=E3QZD3_COLGM|nr:uncharacterized protein GLRG_11366 [Colletotrichum graminicola M1.001]EFQ36221.1 hypothetical protein GLRG_11366 [Colletotrichum graminicola M1.001]WDK13375.1 hypothetical protein CGRA01v4_04656 [Colletotrichum graminicola]
MTKMADSKTSVKMSAEAYPYRDEKTRHLSIDNRPIDTVTYRQRTTTTRVAVSNTILIGISAAIGFMMVTGTDVALWLLLYLDRKMPITYMLAWELFFVASWAIVSWIMYKILVFVKFAPFRGAKHSERHQC